jgi:hypothetical protein
MNDIPLAENGFCGTSAFILNSCAGTNIFTPLGMTMFPAMIILGS